MHTEDLERGAVGAVDVLLAELHERAQCSRRRVELAHPELVHDLPVARRVRVVRQTYSDGTRTRIHTRATDEHLTLTSCSCNNSLQKQVKLIYCTEQYLQNNTYCTMQMFSTLCNTVYIVQYRTYILYYGIGVLRIYGYHICSPVHEYNRDPSTRTAERACKGTTYSSVQYTSTVQYSTLSTVVLTERSDD